MKRWPAWSRAAVFDSSLRIVASSDSSLIPGPAELEDILSISCNDFAGSRILVSAGRTSVYLIWIREVFEPATWTLEDAVSHVNDFLQRGNSSSTTFVAGIADADDEEKRPGTTKTHLVSIQSFDSEGSQSFTLPYHDRVALEFHLETSRPQPTSFWRKNLSFVLALVILICVGLALSATSFIHEQEPSIWMTWQIPSDSKGPQYQLQFTYPHPNFTSWASQTGHDADDFFVRLDDLTMMPLEAVDDDELRYHAWFEERYPWIEEVAESKDYLNESYWLHPRNFALPIDHEYHVAHCILALKRYWKARESQTHVCPRDLEHEHMSHCFDVLEKLAIPDFIEHDDGVDEKIDAKTNIWLVNACF